MSANFASSLVTSLRPLTAWSHLSLLTRWQRMSTWLDCLRPFGSHRFLAHGLSRLSGIQLKYWHRIYEQQSANRRSKTNERSSRVGPTSASNTLATNQNK